MQPSSPNPLRLSTEDAFVEMLAIAVENLERPARGQFLQCFLKSIAHVDVVEAQSIEVWEQALTRRREFSERTGKNVALQAALIDVLSSANLLRMPVVMEYEQYRKLQNSAATDPLTGLYNRRVFDDYLEKELNRAVRYSYRFALVVLDLHRFKEVNDRYGHPQGDVLLQLVATTLLKSIRTSDYAFRVGGDEFALLLPQSETEQAAALSRRLRAAYVTAIAPLRLGVPLALDYGLAVYPDDGEKQEILIRVADERLYQLKKTAQPSDPEKLENKDVLPPVWRAPESQSILGAEAPATERRRWERVSLTGTSAYVLIEEASARSIRVLDLGYGGVALEAPSSEELEEAFEAVLHVPILPTVRVLLRQVYQGGATSGSTRIGCSFDSGGPLVNQQAQLGGPGRQPHPEAPAVPAAGNTASHRSRTSSDAKAKERRPKSFAT